MRFSRLAAAVLGFTSIVLTKSAAAVVPPGTGTVNQFTPCTSPYEINPPLAALGPKSAPFAFDDGVRRFVLYQTGNQIQHYNMGPDRQPGTSDDSYGTLAVAGGPYSYVLGPKTDGDFIIYTEGDLALGFIWVKAIDIGPDGQPGTGDDINLPPVLRRPTATQNPSASGIADLRDGLLTFSFPTGFNAPPEFGSCDLRAPANDPRSCLNTQVTFMSGPPGFIVDQSTTAARIPFSPLQISFATARPGTIFGWMNSFSVAYESHLQMVSPWFGSKRDVVGFLFQNMPVILDHVVGSDRLFVYSLLDPTAPVLTLNAPPLPNLAGFAAIGANNHTTGSVPAILWGGKDQELHVQPAFGTTVYGVPTTPVNAGYTVNMKSDLAIDGNSVVWTQSESDPTSPAPVILDYLMYSICE